MKITTSNATVFTTVTVELELTTQAEVNALYAVGNFSAKVASELASRLSDAGEVQQADVNAVLSPLHHELRRYINKE